MKILRLGLLSGMAANLVFFSSAGFAKEIVSQNHLKVDKAYLKVSSFERATSNWRTRLSPKSRELHFGLSPQKKQALYDLSGGKVDFAGIFVDDSLTGSSSSISESEFIDSFGSSQYTPPGFIANTAQNYRAKKRYSPIDLPGDPMVERSWWYDAINAKPAWELATGRGVTIADCDAGYYTDEADLIPNLVHHLKHDFADIDAPSIVEDGNYTFHGTAVAAMLVATHDGQGTNGLAFNSKLVPLQNFNYNSADDKDKEEATAECILGAIQMPEVKVIVLENQTHGSSETFAGTREAVKLALMAGITIVSAAGNSTNELREEAANDTGSIIVGALSKAGRTASFSNYGARVSIAAYGEELLTVYGPNGAEGLFGGTSGATPQVAGAVALMLETNQNLTPEKIKEILIATREESPTTASVGGKLNVFNAVQMATASISTTSPKEMAKRNKFRREILQILKKVPSTD